MLSKIHLKLAAGLVHLPCRSDVNVKAGGSGIIAAKSNYRAALFFPDWINPVREKITPTRLI